MSRAFKYDVVTLIELVERRPCLWDKTMDYFKDKAERQTAWKEICAFLDNGFLEMDKKDQQRMGQLVNVKWQNVRDSFVKSLRKRSGQSTTKRYIYHDNLQFLMKGIQKDDDMSAIQDLQTFLDTDDEEQEGLEVEKISQNKRVLKSEEACNLRKKARLQRDIHREVMKALNSKNTVQDEDEAFFLSVTPAIKKLSEDDKLEFRIGVLQLLKEINNRNKNCAVVALEFSHASTS